MGIIKLFILGLVIWLGFKIYTIIQQRLALKVRRALGGQIKQTSAASRQLSSDLVPCNACGVHLPKETAVAENGDFYCPPENNDCKR